MLNFGSQSPGLREPFGGFVMGLFRGFCRGQQVPYWLRASRLLLRAFRVLLGAKLLLNTRCRLFDLLHCRGSWGGDG